MNRLLEVAHKQLRRIEVVMAVIAGLTVLALMVLGVAEVLGRTILNKPIPGSIDIVKQLMVPVAAFGIAYCQSEFGNVRMTLLTQKTSGRAKWVLEAFSLGVATLVALSLVKGSWMYFMRSWEMGGDTPQLGIPLWIGILAATASLALLFLRLVIQFGESLCLVALPDSEQIFTANLNNK